MARRSWRTGPDQVRETLDGRHIAVVSRQAQIESVADALVMADRAGGTVAVLFGRAATGLEGEMVTTELLVTWQDRGDAKPQYEEPVAFEPQEGVPLLHDPEHGPEEALSYDQAAAVGLVADPDDVEAQMEAEGRLDGIAEPQEA